jgi:hypothetical protein
LRGYRPDVAEQQRIDRKLPVGDRSEEAARRPVRDTPLWSGRTGWRQRGRP